MFPKGSTLLGSVQGWGRGSRIGLAMVVGYRRSGPWSAF
jgi:hypothetical protein